MGLVWKPTEFYHTEITMTISLGIDIGREHDLTALVLVEETDSGEVWVRKASTMRQTPFDIQEAEIRAWKEMHDPSAIVIDKTYNPQLAENMRAEWPWLVQEFGFTEQSKADLIGKALELFTAGEGRGPPRDRLIPGGPRFLRKEITPAGNGGFPGSPP